MFNIQKYDNRTFTNMNSTDAIQMLITVKLEIPTQ